MRNAFSLRLLPCFRIRPDPEKVSSGSSLRPPARCGAETQYVAALSAGYNAICCIPHPDRDLMPGGRYCRFAYSVCVVHFRKVVISQKIGSAGNGHPVITTKNYKPVTF